MGRWIKAQKPLILLGKRAASLSSGDMTTPKTFLWKDVASSAEAPDEEDEDSVWVVAKSGATIKHTTYHVDRAGFISQIKTYVELLSCFGWSVVIGSEPELLSKAPKTTEAVMASLKDRSMRAREIRNSDESIPRQKPGTRQTQFPLETRTRWP